MRRIAPNVRVLAFALMLSWSGHAVAQIRLNYVPGELLIKRRAVAGATLRALPTDLVTATLDRFEFINVERVRLRAGVDVHDAILRLRRDPTVGYAEPNYLVQAEAFPNDSLFSSLWGLDNRGQSPGLAGVDVRAVAAWDITTGDPDLKIGVIDTGVDYRHPDLMQNIWVNEAEASGITGVDDDGNGYVDDIHGYDFAYNDGDPFDDHFHGTHCAGTIAGRGNNRTGVVGVNWQAKIVAIKFLNNGGSGTTVDAIRSIQYAIKVGCRLTSNSWGGDGFSQSMFDAVAAAGGAGQLFIAAAGNSSGDNDRNPFYPASYTLPNVISVAALDPFGNKAGFSNYGATSVDLGAPGVSILSTLPNNSYGLLSGTSMATPHVAGVAGLVWSRFPWLGPQEVKDILLQTATSTLSLAGITVTGGRVNAAAAVKGLESVRPAPIVDLQAVDVASTSVALRWTATGDDENIGTALRYELRTSAAPLDESNFEAATLASSPKPQAAGSPEQWTITGLPAATEVYIAIRAVDRFLQKGLISNVVHVTTLPPPALVLDRTSISSSGRTGTRQTEVITLHNPSAGVLEFSIQNPELLGFTGGGDLGGPHGELQSEGAGTQPAPKGALDAAPGRPVMDARGGPDAFGYRWIDDQDPLGPTFDWVDIAASGAVVLSAGDDAVSAPIPIGFEFPMYGQRFSSVVVCSNGFLSFSSSESPYANREFPTASGVPNMIAPLWDDLVVDGSARVVARSEPDRFIVSWIGVRRFPSGGPYTFQAILDATGTIRFQYLELAQLVPSATIGLQDETRGRGLTVASNAPYLRERSAVRIRPMPEWLSLSAQVGRLAPGASTALTLTFDGSSLQGEYDAALTLASNAPAAPVTPIAVHLSVAGAGDVATTPSTLDFGEVMIGSAATETLRVRNTGLVPLHVTQVSSSGTEVVVGSPSPFTVPAGGSHDVFVTYAPPSPGALAATLTVVSDDPDESSLAVPMVGQAIGVPIARTSGSLLFEQDLDRSVVHTVHLRNAGQGPLRWTSRLDLEPPPPGEVDPVWATVSPPSEEAAPGDSSSIAVRVSSQALTIGGVYRGTLAVHTNDPLRPDLKWAIEMTVIVRPLLTMVAAVDFDTVLVGAEAKRVVSLRNEGSGSLVIDSIGVTGASFAATVPALPVVVASGRALDLDVMFHPSAACNPCSGELGVRSNSRDALVHTAALSGIGSSSPRLDVIGDSLRLATATDLGPSALADSRSVRLHNSGGSLLRVDLALTAAPLDPVPAAPFDTGIPGAAGDYWSPDSSGRGQPAFDWVDVTDGVALPIYDDETLATDVPLGFSFPFFGRRFDRVNVTSNGYLSFTSRRIHAGGNVALPDSRPFVPENIVAPLWDDLWMPPTSVYARAAGDRFVVSWIGAEALHGTTRGGPFTFQAILEPSGRIVFQYLRVGSESNESTIGIQDESRTRGLTVVSDAYYVRDHMAIEILPPGAPWAALQHSQVAILPGDTVEVAVTGAGTGLATGEYITWLRIGSDSPLEPRTNLPVVMRAGSEPTTMTLQVEPAFYRPGPGLVTARVAAPAGCGSSPFELEDVELLGGFAPSGRSTSRWTGCDLDLDFERVEILTSLEDGDLSPLRLTGRIPGRSWIVADATVRMLRPELVRPGGTYAAGQPVTLNLSGPEGGPPSFYFLWFSPDLGLSWTQVNGYLPPGSYTWIVPRTPTKKGLLELVAFAQSDSVWVGDAFSGPFTIPIPPADVTGEHAPAPLSLRIAGAHPARDGARFSLSLPQNRAITLDVHDLRGARVRRVCAGEYAAGTHELSWDGRSDQGVRVAPGLYFVRMAAGPDRRELKLVMTR